MEDPSNELTQEQPQDLSWYQSQVSKVLNFFTTPNTAPREAPATTAPIEAPANTASIEAPAYSVALSEGVPFRATEETSATALRAKPPTLPVSQPGETVDGFSRDEFVRLYRDRPAEFAAKYAEKYPAQVAKQLAQSISFD